MPRLRTPKETGRTKRLGASVVVSCAVHAIVAAVLGGMVYRLAEASTKPTRRNDIMMAIHASANADYMAKRGQIGPNLDELLKDAKGSLGSLNLPGTTAIATGNLAETLNAVDPNATGGSVSTAVSGESGTSAALGNLPSGTGVVFAGLRASGEQARCIVYVIDGSGPMLSSLADVLGEVNRSIERLLPTQKFGVVVFRDNADGTIVDTFDTALREANPRNATALRGWMAKLPAQGRSNPMDGLRAAIALRPQVIFLLSRSITRTGGGVWDLGPDATLAELDRLNPANPDGSRPILIKTIQFQEPDPTGTMERIAKSHGTIGPATIDGPAYRVMKREELDRR